MRVSATIAASLVAISGVALANLPAPVVDSDYHFEGVPDPAQVELGRRLFFDKIMSGNRNIACATCHHPLLASADNWSLGIGEGGQGLGATRDWSVGDPELHGRIGRNAPALFNLGAKEFVAMGVAGAEEVDPARPAGFSTFAGRATPLGLNSVLAAQALFPIASRAEMLGHSGENEIAADTGPGSGGFPTIWDALTERLRGIPEYVTLFSQAFDDVNTAQDIKIKHFANAVAVF